jgi:hypothetical protein
MIQQNLKLAQIKPEILTKKKVENMDQNILKMIGACFSNHSI